MAATGRQIGGILAYRKSVVQIAVETVVPHSGIRSFLFKSQRVRPDLCHGPTNNTTNINNATHTNNMSSNTNNNNISNTNNTTCLLCVLCVVVFGLCFLFCLFPHMYLHPF